MVFDRHDVGQTVAAGSASGQHFVEDLRVADVLHIDLDVGVFFIEAFDRRFQCRSGDVPAPDCNGSLFCKGRTGSE
ncbi:hypothetical protein RHSP_23020 [Rhizobium freirei PRF 81]|uniref:Uncharacterized protein n=1 Tax=Rhizobium freirei PRF 81 TaxID=363754 RepID=N6UUD5_9HYPH|nr:hypothetical protein RHSP_23020 [Rhizobium freirei PRF 81]